MDRTEGPNSSRTGNGCAARSEVADPRDSIAAEQKRQPAVDNSIDELDIAVTRLEKTASELYGRLAPVSNREEGGVEGADRQHYGVPIADRLSSYAASIYNLNSILRNAIDELEV